MVHLRDDLGNDAHLGSARWQSAGGKRVGVVLLGAARSGRKAERDADQPPQGQARDPNASHRRDRAGGRASGTGCRALGRRQSHLADAADYAHLRIAFGAPLSEKPLHLQTLAELQAQFQACFLLTFRAVELLGREEANEATDTDRLLLRLIQTIVKLWTAKHAVWNASEILEAFGGAGYVEDSGLPALLRDAQVLPIWEGTTNVLALDTLRALGQAGTLEALTEELTARANAATHAELQGARKSVITTVERIAEWLRRPHSDDPHAVEAAARALAMKLGRAWGLALMLEHAQGLPDRGSRRRSALAAHQLSGCDPDFLDGILATDEAPTLAFG